MAKLLQPGTPAPDVRLTAQEGKTVSLKDLLGQKTMVLYFYPKDDTPGCTKESCSFRDSYEDFLQAGADVIGVSSDSSASHEQFATKYRLPFRLLSDLDGSVAKAFGVGKKFGLMPGRVTFIIDRSGTIRDVFDSQFQALQHVSRAREVVKGLEAKPA